MSNVKNIGKIDIHAHATAFREYHPPHRPEDPDSVFVSAEHVIEFYDKLGIEKGILLPIVSPEGQTAPMTSEAAKYLTVKYPDRFYWFCNVDPRAYPNKKDGNLKNLINHYKSFGAKGVGEVTSQIEFEDPKAQNLFTACEACDMPVTIHIAPTVNNSYGLLDELGLPGLEKTLKNHPNLKILGHSQAFYSEISADVTAENRDKYPTGPVKEGGRMVELMRRYPNLYCDLSAGSGSNALMRDPEFAVKFIEEFSDRLMYACDICHPANTHPFVFRDFLEKMLDEGKISEENYVKLVRENAIRILKLED